MRKAWIWWIAAAAVFLIFGGYRDSNQLEDMFLAQGIGIDASEKEDGIITLTLSGPTFTEGAKEPLQVLSSQGYSVDQALSHMQNKVQQNLSAEHARVLIFGKEAAKSGISRYMDFLIRDPSVRSDMYLVVADGKAEELLRTKLKQDPFIALYLTDMLEKGFKQTRIPRSTLLDVLEALTAKGKDPALPFVGVATGRDSLVLHGIAVFDEDKYAGALLSDEAAAFMLLSNRLSILNVTYESPYEVKETKIFSTIKLYNGKTQKKCTLKGNKVFIDMHFSGEADIVEHATTHPLSPDNIKQEEKAAAQRLEDMMKKAVDKLQKQYKSDALGLGEIVRVQFPAYYKKVKWKDIYPNITIRISADVAIRRTGTVK